MYPVGAFVSTNVYFPGAKLATSSSPFLSVVKFSATVAPCSFTNLKTAPSKDSPLSFSFFNLAVPW